jgi:hypothetical protein
MLLPICCISLAACAADLPLGCTFPEQTFVACVSDTHFELRRCSKSHESRNDVRTRGGGGGGVEVRQCPSGHRCAAFSRALHGAGSCVHASGAPIGSDEDARAMMVAHLPRAVSLQTAYSVDVLEAADCAGTADSGVADAVGGRLLCEALDVSALLQPSFGHNFANTWVTRTPSSANGSGTVFGCEYADAAGWRACLGRNSARQNLLYVRGSPGMLMSGGLMEYLHQDNLDDPTDFEACCKPGTAGIWGSNQTCVPDITSQCAQDYYVSWGQVLIDAGVRAFFFGQARLTGDSRGCQPATATATATAATAANAAIAVATATAAAAPTDATAGAAAAAVGVGDDPRSGCSRVTAIAAASFGAVISRLQACVCFRQSRAIQYPHCSRYKY